MAGDGICIWTRPTVRQIYSRPGINLSSRESWSQSDSCLGGGEMMFRIANSAARLGGLHPASLSTVSSRYINRAVNCSKTSVALARSAAFSSDVSAAASPDCLPRFFLTTSLQRPVTRPVRRSDGSRPTRPLRNFDACPVHAVRVPAALGRRTPERSTQATFATQ